MTGSSFSWTEAVLVPLAMTLTRPRTPRPEKSDYEKQLERQIANTTDQTKEGDYSGTSTGKGRDGNADADNRNAAQLASQIKAQEIAEQAVARRFPVQPALAGQDPADQKTPDAVMKMLADYLSFDGPQQAPAPPPMQNTRRRHGRAGNGGAEARHEDERRDERVRRRKAVIGICFRRWPEDTNLSIFKRRPAGRSHLCRGGCGSLLYQLQLSLTKRGPGMSRKLTILISGAKAQSIFQSFRARLKSCPDTKQCYSADGKAIAACIPQERYAKVGACILPNIALRASALTGSPPVVVASFLPR